MRVSSDRVSLARRRFLGGALVLLCVPPALTAACTVDGSGAGGSTAPGGAGGAGTGTTIGPWQIPPGTVLSAERYAVLCALMDALIPGDASSPGAVLAQAPYYLDQLLGAFRADPPLIFAGGPTSGRHGGTDAFAEFQRLTRVEELRWRTTIEGSQGLAEREWNGPVKGLRQEVEEGLDALDALARGGLDAGFALAELADRQHLLPGMDEAFRTSIYGFAVEGTYGDPVYGGNHELAGWSAIGYEGDRQPIGFSAHQMAHPEEG
jgi:gluconate 2-dehydrogenase gamma chain